MVVSNPPYDGELHLQILNELTKVSKKTVCIHPARWVEDILAQYKSNGATGKKYEHLKNMLTKVKMIKQKDGCKMFKIGLPQDMMIGVYENDQDNNGVLPIYDDSQRFFDVLEKVLNYAKTVKSLGDMDEENKIDGIRVEVKLIVPQNVGAATEYARTKGVTLTGKTVLNNGYDPDGNIWFREGGKRPRYEREDNAPIPHSIQFPTVELAQSFINLYRTPIVRNIIHMLKYDQHSGHTHIPYFDPKVIKTEDDVLDALGITDETHRQWMKRDVYDYREKDFIKYGEWIDC